MLTFTNLIPIFLVFILYFLGMPIVYALFGSTFFYFLFINTTVVHQHHGSALDHSPEGHELHRVLLHAGDPLLRHVGLRHELRRDCR